MRLLFSLLALILLASCAESDLPNPTGKGTIRAINAIKASPEVAFRIEERVIDALKYKVVSASPRFDDFEYPFNFDARLAGKLEPQRIASKVQKIDADGDYTFVLTGAIATPDVTVWQYDKRVFADTDSVTQARFANLAASQNSIDFYFAAPGVSPTAGAAIGTITYGDVLPPQDFPAGSYVITITPPGDPATILYQSTSIAYAPRTANIIPVFDGNEQDLAPYNVRVFPEQGGVSNLPDVRYAPTIRFIQTSIDLPPADIYDDEALTSLVLTEHKFADVSGDITTGTGDTTYRYTPTGNPGAILFEQEFEPTVGAHKQLIVMGSGSERTALIYQPDRESTSTLAKLRVFQGSSNHDILDVYFVAAGIPITEEVPRLSLPYKILSEVFTMPAGDYDMYVTPRQDKTIVAGPVSIDLALGDTIEILLLDTVDPATAAISVVPPL
ncbi:MAG TPA: DUF4397 domain-containing protein [Woeseiaceae bacterium]|nr:DUF4397 domain-containing protein [Woeseiaceae bacterium]